MNGSAPANTANERGRTCTPREARLNGAPFRSDSYGRKEFGFYRATDPWGREQAVGHLAVCHRRWQFFGPERQTCCAEAPHLLDATGINTATRHRLLFAGILLLYRHMRAIAIRLGATRYAKGSGRRGSLHRHPGDECEDGQRNQEFADDDQRHRRKLCGCN